MASIDGVDVGQLTTVELVERQRSALVKCHEQPDDDDISLLDYVPVVALFNWATSTEEADKRTQDQWCEIARDAGVELARRGRAEVVAAEKEARERAVQAWGPGALFGPSPAAAPGQSPGFFGVVGQDVRGVAQDVSAAWQGPPQEEKATFFDKLNPLYWVGRAYDAGLDTIGLGAEQEAEARAVGLVRLLLLIAVAAGVVWVVGQAVGVGTAFGAASQDRLLSSGLIKGALSGL